MKLRFIHSWEQTPDSLKPDHIITSTTKGLKRTTTLEEGQKVLIDMTSHKRRQGNKMYGMHEVFKDDSGKQRAEYILRTGIYDTSGREMPRIKQYEVILDKKQIQGKLLHTLSGGTIGAGIGGYIGHKLTKKPEQHKRNVAIGAATGGIAGVGA